MERLNFFELSTTQFIVLPAQTTYNSSVGRNFNRDQNTVCVLLFVSFVTGIVGVYFNRVGGIRVGRYAIFTAIALVPVCFLYLRKFYEVLNAVLLASLSGMTIGGGIGMLGMWYITQNPNRMWLGPKWLVIGAVLTAAFVISVKKLKVEPVKLEILDEELQSMTDLERLKHLEKSLSDDAVFQPISKAPLDPLGLAFSGVGLIMAVPAIASAESTQERLIMIGILVSIIPLGIWFVKYMRRRTFANYNAIIADINVHRQEVLTKVRSDIKEREGSVGDGLPPPTETA